MATRDLKASMGRGNEIPQSREEYLEQKKAKEEVAATVAEKAVEVPKTVPVPTIEKYTPQAKINANNGAQYTRKGYYALTEANYWYLKDITYIKNIDIRDYLNQLIEIDIQANGELLDKLSHYKSCIEEM